MCSKRGMANGSRATGDAGRLWGRRAALGMLVGVAAARLARGRTVAVNVAPVDHAGLLGEVTRHRGKVVVLDCWSTSCPPCIREFPGLVRLAAAHPDRVACLSLALEYDGVGTVAELLPPVREFLVEVGAHAVVNMIATEEVDAMVRQLDIVGVPAVVIWRPDGTLAACYDDDRAAKALGRPFTYADVEATVEGLLTAAGR